MTRRSSVGGAVRRTVIGLADKEIQNRMKLLEDKAGHTAANIALSEIRDLASPKKSNQKSLTEKNTRVEYRQGSGGPCAIENCTLDKRFDWTLLIEGGEEKIAREHPDFVGSDNQAPWEEKGWTGAGIFSDGNKLLAKDSRPLLGGKIFYSLGSATSLYTPLCTFRTRRSILFPVLMMKKKAYAKSCMEYETAMKVWQRARNERLKMELARKEIFSAKSGEGTGGMWAAVTKRTSTERRGGITMGSTLDENSMPKAPLFSPLLTMRELLPLVLDAAQCTALAASKGKRYIH